MIRGKTVLLIVGGGVAAYKTPILIRRLREKGVGVRAVLTNAGAQFVTPLTLGSVSGETVHHALFDLTEEAKMGHIELSRSADLLVVAPATADLMAKMAAGLADDLATTLLLATDKPVMIAPSMNVRMWQHPATRSNLDTLQQRDVSVIGPEEGEMACGEFGPGRMAEPEDIAAAILKALSESAPIAIGNTPLATLDGPSRTRLSGRRFVVTSGPTHEPIDPVRYIANRSSGKQGHAIAEALAREGAEVVLVSGPTRLPRPAGCELRRIETAEQMLVETIAALPADCVICAAAVADYRVEHVADQKIKKDGESDMRSLSLVENPDILNTVSTLATDVRPRLVVGFAAETENVIDNAKAKRARKGCDWIVANDVSSEQEIFGGDENKVTLVTGTGEESWERMSKISVAERLVDRIAQALATDTGT